jgi:hypothetical protein
MNWQNPKLNEIQSIEDNLIFNANCGSNSTLFTNFIHSTSEWIDKECNAKKIHISPFKVELDKQVELVAYHIECGMVTDAAILSIGKQPTEFRSKLTDTHHNILWAARKKRKHNRKY